jgi:hypothetical protein
MIHVYSQSHLTNMLRLLITTHVQVKPKQEMRLMKIISEYELYMPASLNDCLITKNTVITHPVNLCAYQGQTPGRPTSKVNRSVCSLSIAQGSGIVTV